MPAAVMKKLKKKNLEAKVADGDVLAHPYIVCAFCFALARSPLPVGRNVHGDKYLGDSSYLIDRIWASISQDYDSSQYHVDGSHEKGRY
jgi:hypothetical protein